MSDYEQVFAIICFSKYAKGDKGISRMYKRAKKVLYRNEYDIITGKISRVGNTNMKSNSLSVAVLTASKVFNYQGN